MPFGACFDATTIGKTIAGPAVPAIDLVLHKEGAKRRIYGANSMVDIGKNVVCLGFVDGGKNPRTSRGQHFGLDKVDSQSSDQHKIIRSMQFCADQHKITLSI
ncbi:hypothetical protein L6164_017102 [Bauhinia variegata]|uniref:Uncharacterized protein n=1 Tax=Bauhinia variegata TaxID=167791 RepID=A0ACB9N6P4_BAUVA|nr:hypothetical protein L6164_017102 [Bauhinia variegata]